MGEAGVNLNEWMRNQKKKAQAHKLDERKRQMLAQIGVEWAAVRSGGRIEIETK